ncbi:MAG: DUF1080 domain-containing protein [Phycisphaeraceae bacterium]
MKPLLTAALLALALLSNISAPPRTLAADDKPSADDDGFVSLIPSDGDTLEGWKVDNDKQAGHWVLKDGVITGDNPDKKGSILWTEQAFGDYELVVEYRTTSEDYDSGVFLRGKSHQVQIGFSRSLKKDLTGALYCPKDGNGSYPQQPDEKIKDAHKPGEWNTLRMVTKGKQITTTLNGVQINNYTAVKYPATGKIGLQLHANVHQTMAFRVVKIRTLGERD